MRGRKGYTTGVFDLFHIGHLNILRNAASCCDHLVVGVTTDELTRKLKGRPPIIPYAERAEIVGALGCVAEVVPQSEIDELGDWRRLAFDVIVKGGDWAGSEKWQHLEREFAALGVDVRFFPYTETTSSTLVRAALERVVVPSVQDRR